MLDISEWNANESLCRSVKHKCASLLYSIEYNTFSEIFVIIWNFKVFCENI